MAKKCSAGHGLSVWNEFDANGQHYAFWGCPKYKELKCKAKQIEDTDEKFVNQVQYPNETREPLIQRDYDAENRGKCRNNFIEANIQHGGIMRLTENEKNIINELVEFAMTGK